MTEAKVRTLVADDEPLARAGLRRLLAAVDWIECVGEAAHGIAAAEAIDALTPDLVLLDVQMPGLSGTDVLRRIRHRPLVLFTTAHAEHAIAAFELGALDYLLKPFGAERLNSALERVRAQLGEARTAAFERCAEALGRAPLQRLFVRVGQRIVPLAVQDIARFEAVGDYIAAHLAGGGAPHLLHLPLAQLEKRLDARRFLRIHRAHLVNLDHVAAFRREPGGQLAAELKDGTLLPVSRARARELRDLAH